MNDKVRLIFEKTKKVIFKKVSIYIIFFLSIILIIFYFSRPPIYNEEKVKYNDEVEILSEDEPYDDTQSAEVIPDLDKTEIDPERKYIDEPKPPTAKKKPKPAKKLEKTEIKKLTNLTPSETVNLLHDTLKKIVNSTFETKKVERVISDTYNTERMLTLIVGEVWKNSENKDQEILKEVFEEYIAKNYILRFKSIKNLEFGKLESSQVGKNYRMVKTKLVINSKDEVPLSYLLNQTNNRWKIFDVLIDGSISEIATKKSEFINFTNEGNLKPLLEALQKKNSILLN